MPVGPNALELKVGGEVVGQVTGDEVIINPDAVTLEGKYWKVGCGIGGLKLVTEGFGGEICLDVELFHAGEILVVEEIILMAFDVVKFPFDGTEVEDAPDRLNDVGVKSVGVGSGVLVADGVNGTFPITMKMYCA